MQESKKLFKYVCTLETNSRCVLMSLLTLVDANNFWNSYVITIF